MYGLISQLLTTPGRRDELARILAGATRALPGCLSYVIALDPARDDALWITEVWSGRDAHDASLRLPAVQEAVAKGRPLIAGVGQRTETRPLASG